MKKIPLEEVLSSKGRIKILKVLALEGELNITAITRKTELNHSAVISHLKFLVKAGLVEEKTFGRVRIYRFKIEDKRARKFLELVKAFEDE